MCTRRRSPWSQFTLPACLPARLSTSQRTTDHRPIRLFVRVHPAGVVLSASLYVYAQNSRFFYYTWGDDKNGGVYVAKLVGWLALLNVEVFLLLEFGKSADILFLGAGTWICLFLILIYDDGPRWWCLREVDVPSSPAAAAQQLINRTPRRLELKWSCHLKPTTTTTLIRLYCSVPHTPTRTWSTIKHMLYIVTGHAYNKKGKIFGVSQESIAHPLRDQ